jgi:hypothetical protein
MNIKHLIKLVAQSAIYVPAESEGIRIDNYETLDDIGTHHIPEDEAGFYGTGEESGEQYKIQYVDINLAEDMFYKLVLVDITEG